ncbi:MAG: VOC family protein, partial [Novosphingobium sp.]
MSLMSVRVGTNDLPKAIEFYDAVLGTLGVAPNSAPAEYGIGMYKLANGPVFLVGGARDGNAATHANGGTVGFVAGSAEEVDAFHAAGLAQGGTCEGEPGPRAQ